jgi:hypothetical protein
MRTRILHRTIGLFALAIGLTVACVDPTIPRLPPDEQNERDKDDGDQTGFDLRSPPPSYLV